MFFYTNVFLCGLFFHFMFHFFTPFKAISQCGTHNSQGMMELGVIWINQAKHPAVTYQSRWLSDSAVL